MVNGFCFSGRGRGKQASVAADAEAGGWWGMGGGMATDLGVCKQGAECICVSFIVVQDCDKFQSESLVSPTALVSAQNGCLRVMEPWSAAAAPQQRRRHRRLPRDECQTRCRLSSRKHLKINNINDDFSLLVTSVRAFLEVMPSLCSGCSLPPPPPTLHPRDRPLLRDTLHFLIASHSIRLRLQI